MSKNCMKLNIILAVGAHMPGTPPGSVNAVPRSHKPPVFVDSAVSCILFLTSHTDKLAVTFNTGIM